MRTPSVKELTQPGIYRHYKGGLYRLLTVATNEADHEPVVVYISLQHGSIWVRPVSSWVESVETQGGFTRRFEYLYNGVPENAFNQKPAP